MKISIVVVLMTAALFACTKAPSSDEAQQGTDDEKTGSVQQATTGVTCGCACLAGYRHYLCDPTPSQPGSGDEFSAGGCTPFSPCQ